MVVAVAEKPLQAESGVAKFTFTNPTLSSCSRSAAGSQIRPASALPNAAASKQPLRILASIALFLILGGFPHFFANGGGDDGVSLPDFKVQKSVDEGSFAF